MSTSNEQIRIIILRHPAGETGIPELYKSWLCISIDDFFLNEDGVYTFRHNRLQEARDWAYNKTCNAIREGIKKILVNNTNNKIWEFEKYVKLAIHNGGQVSVWKVLRLTSSNSKNAYKEQIRRYAQGYEPWDGELNCIVENGTVKLMRNY